MGKQSLDIPNLIPGDWKRADQVIRKIKTKLGHQSSPAHVGMTLTGLTASALVGTDASKALESVTIGTGLAYARPTISFSHLGIEALTDPGVDKIMFWDDSATACKWLGVGNSIAITDVTLDTIQDIRTTATPTFGGLITTGTIDASAGKVLVEDNATVAPTDELDGYIGVAIVAGEPRIYFHVEGNMYFINTDGIAMAPVAGNPIGLALILTYA